MAYMSDIHPELEEGEIFLTNAGWDDDDFNEIGWTTKRAGMMAYDIHDRFIDDGSFAVFVQRSELDVPRIGANPEDHHYCESCKFDYNKTGVSCGVTWPRGALCSVVRRNG